MVPRVFKGFKGISMNIIYDIMNFLNESDCNGFQWISRVFKSFQM